jgi:hypothetical protein
MRVNNHNLITHLTWNRFTTTFVNPLLFPFAKMHFSPFVLSAGLCAAATIPRRAEHACTNPAKRAEWRTLSEEVRKQYIDAVLCMKTKPSGIGLNTTRYDDFPYVHTHLDQTSTYSHLPPPSHLHCLAA